MQAHPIPEVQELPIFVPTIAAVFKYRMLAMYLL